MSGYVFFFNDPATTEIYTLSLHDALPISRPAPSPARPSRLRSGEGSCCGGRRRAPRSPARTAAPTPGSPRRSEEHTSELQSRQYLVCRLLLEKKKTYNTLVLNPSLLIPRI